MQITWFGHSAFRVEIGSSVIIIDPVPVRQSGV